MASLRHPLLEKGTYERLRRNDVLELRPHILHFGGFNIHQEHSQVLRILNVSASSMNMKIIGPATQWFRISYEKKGLLAPGMSENVTVTFTPHEWRYYYDTVKIFCGDQADNLIVPIHAYPAANDVALPRIIDFGRVPIGATRTRIVPLTCKIPIQFEYEFTLLEEHPDIRLTPLSGTIPADGAVDVVVTFAPTRHRTARAELQFAVSQFDFEPVPLTVMGSCPPDLTRDATIAAAQRETEAALAEAFAPKARVPKEKRAARKDAAKVERGDKQKEPKSMVVAKGEEELTQEMACSEVQANLVAHAAILKRYVQESHLDEEDDGREHATRRKREDKLKESRFHQDVARADTALSKPVVAVPEGFRIKQAPRWDEAENDTELLRRQVVDRFVRAGSRCIARVRAQRRCVQLREAMRAAGAVDRGSCRAWVEAESKSAEAGGKSQERAAGEGLQEPAGIKGEGVEQEKPGERFDVVHIPLSGFVLPVQLPTATSGSQPEERLPVEVTPLDDFQEFLPVELNTRLDYKVLRYERMTVPPPAAYPRLHTDDARFQAALEEYPWRGPRGDELDGAEVAMVMPESCLLAPEHDPLSLLVPSAECRTCVPLPDYAECDPEFRLAQPAPLIGDLETELLLPHCIPSIDAPWLAAWRRTRQLPDPFRLFDPEPASFAEAGGPRGPRLGGDAGGERLSFMPASTKSRAEELQAVRKAKEIIAENAKGAEYAAHGLAQVRQEQVVSTLRQLAKKEQSTALAQLSSRVAAAVHLAAQPGEDPLAKVKSLIQEVIEKLEKEVGEAGGRPLDLRTLGSGGEERETTASPPGDKSYEAALSMIADRTSVIDVDMWRKERAAEARLRKLAAAGGKAVRERLGELNADLRPRNKLFLG